MQLSMLFFAQLWISIALVPSSSDDSRSSMASLDGFADEFSRIMDSQGTGTTKYNYLDQKHLEVIEMAGPVATKIQEFIENNDTQNLLLAWQKLLPILSKLEHYETVSQPDLDKQPPPQKKSGIKERTRAEWNKFVLIPLNKFQRVLGTHLSTNQTTLSDLPCEGDQNSFNDASKRLFGCCVPYAFASGEIQEYGQEAFDYLHAKFHDALLRTMFYMPFCDAYGCLYDEPYICTYNLTYNYHKRAIAKFFNKTDSNMDYLLAKNQAIVASETSRFANHGKPQILNMSICIGANPNQHIQKRPFVLSQAELTSVFRRPTLMRLTKKLKQTTAALARPPLRTAQSLFIADKKWFLDVL
ncbi:hypothetical protein DdX_13280 [Ditylenchus destructor]|uniref:Uncharacterized protein n=1 Tax=Ditylenchus destructor TaxID=166010 RepID=A0AAD4R2S5_9BILA|nr:hypothetical protein DdX_13280 [Ditylenchus destructor]